LFNRIVVANIMSKKTHQSAIVLMPPADTSVYQAVQDVRRQHDRQFHRWMPHINLSYPFYEPDQMDSAVAKLTPHLSNLSPFRVRLAEFGHFSHGGKSATVWLDPVEPDRDLSNNNSRCPNLMKLQSVLASVFPDCLDLQSKGGFRPHLTMAQCASVTAVEELKRALSKDWPSSEPSQVEFLASSVEFIHRTGPDVPFVVLHSVPLGGGGACLAQPVTR
ncbi:hypothetical protein BOX15_Mlig019835g1, partial [Macrostomum lignano]